MSEQHLEQCQLCTLIADGWQNLRKKPASKGDSSPHFLPAGSERRALQSIKS